MNADERRLTPTWQADDGPPTAPFPWFGGKRRVAAEVWAALGDVYNYIEPFAGSLAILLGRPAEHTGHTETVNDKDAYLANFWRALQAVPEEVARYADWPVNETDLMARHLWLVNEGQDRIARMEADPEFYDAKVAGWWVWGICSWIGSGWCALNAGPWIRGPDGRVCRRSDGNAGQGVNRKLPHLGDAGRGVNRRLPHLGNRGLDKPGRETDPARLIAYFQSLADRLRRVRVCCGDWRRVVTRGVMAHGETVGVFLDPPYDTDVRGEVYNTDGEHGQISGAVREWCLANGDDPRLRIVLAGYESEHVAQMPDTWRVLKWSAGRSYGQASGPTDNSENRHNERLWFSPHCLKPEAEELGLFAGIAT